MTQLTEQQCDAEIAKLQQLIPEMQTKLQQMLGYRQALIDIREQENSEENSE
tara:strand:- start:79 stop:234 length:156 start_codon:yes stop_codon:yes gene_type:complete